LGMAVAAEPPTPATFTARFAEALQAAPPSVKVSIVRDLQLDIRRGDGTSAIVSLVNNYRDYSADPKWFDEVVKAYAAALAKPAGKQAAKLDRTRIVPVIKDRPWLAELQGQFRQQDASQQPVFEDFNNELVVVYAEDTSDRTRYLSSSENLGVERSKLRALSVDNLMRIMPRIDLRQGDDGLAMMTHADYGASLLLVDSIWSGDQVKVDGDIVVAVPAKDVILITGSRNRKGLKATRTAAPKLAKGSYGITDTLFVYRKGRFVKFGRD